MTLDRRIAAAILAGGLLGGALDLAYALTFSASRGVAPARVLRFIAAGLLGPSALQGGTGTAVLGLVVHFAIACVMAAVFTLIAVRLPALVRRPFLWGPLYGLGLWLVMRFLVLPLTANPPKALPAPASIITDILSHAFFVGLVIALFARWAILGAKRGARA